MVSRAFDARLLGTVCAAEKSIACLDAVADDLAPAMCANRRKLMNRTLKRIKNMPISSSYYFE